MPDGFDVFLSHNSRDKPIVEEIGARLRGEGLRVWLDKWELRPGFPWQEGIEEGLRLSRAAAVFVGADGLGPWQEPEMRASIARSRHEKKMPVIPVLLPGCPDSPQLPLFLEALTWVDLRDGMTADGLAQLVWGITGTKRSAEPAPETRRSTAWWRWGVALSLLVALAVAAWLWLRPPEPEPKPLPPSPRPVSTAVRPEEESHQEPEPEAPRQDGASGAATTEPASFPTKPLPSPAPRETTGLEHVPATLADYAQKVGQLPLGASVYEKDLQEIVHLIRESTVFEREHPRDAATAYRLYAASLLLQGSANQSPMRAIDVAYPWVREALRFKGAFRDQNDLQEAEEFFGKLLLGSSPEVDMAVLLTHKFRVAMLEASAADVSNWVDQTLCDIIALKKDPKLADAVADAASGRRSEPAAGDLSPQEAAALRVGLDLGGSLLATMLTGTAKAGGYERRTDDLAASLTVLGLSEPASRLTVAQVETAMRNPNPITASSLLFEQVNSVSDFLKKRCAFRLAAVLRIGFVVGYVSESSRFIQERFAPTGDQLDQLTAGQEKYTRTLASDIRVARLPKGITQPLEEIAALLQKTPLDLKAVADQCNKFERMVAQQQLSPPPLEGEVREPDSFTSSTVFVPSYAFRSHRGRTAQSPAV